MRLKEGLGMLEAVVFFYQDCMDSVVVYFNMLISLVVVGYIISPVVSMPIPSRRLSAGGWRNATVSI